VAQAGVLTASLAHEVNQPLAAILSNAQAGERIMAGPDPDLDEIRGILSDIVADDKRAASVIAGLRAMLRRRETRRERIALSQAIRDVLALLRSEYIAHDVRVEAHVESDCVLVADRGQLQQVIVNLMMNAAEATEGLPPERRRVEVSVRATRAGMALIAVRDWGRGVPEDGQASVFDSFWTTKPDGMGIGLAICRTIVEAHGGTLWYANHAGQGATFFVSLPLGGHPDAAAAAGSADGV
jgi:C4-dicarboxylate-specific signal transduction histidine kinase